jgi:DNA-binding Lrp family transcriptional regulator
MPKKERNTLKDNELRLISELMKNSRRSDRELAKALGISQPTVGRLLKRLDKEGVIREYTIIPDFQKLGYNLVAMTLGKVREEYWKPDLIDETRRQFVEAFNKSALQVILDERGLGMKFSGIIVSFHRSYSEYADFKKWIRQMPFIDASNLESFVLDLNDKVHHRYLTFSYLAKHLLQNTA